MKNQKELMKLSWGAAPKLDIKENTKNDHIYTAELLEQYLIVTLFYLDGTPHYRFIQSIDDWILQEIGSETPRTSCIDKITDYYGKEYPSPGADEIIKSFVKNARIGTYKYSLCYSKNYGMPSNGLTDLYNLQRHIREVNVKKRHDKIRNSIDDAMLEIKEIPADVYNWAERVLMKNNSYIFYTYKAGKKKQEGYCNHCHKEMIIENAKHNKAGKCPNCHAKIKYIARGAIRRSENRFILDSKTFYYFQKTKDGICGRNFIVSTGSCIDEKIAKEVRLNEIGREFRHAPNFYLNKAYYYGDFLNTGEKRWCLGNDYVNYHARHIYPNNLKSICEKIDILKYMPLDVIVKQAPLDSTNFFRNAVSNPCLEYLIKLGLCNIAIDILNGSTYKSKIDLAGKNITEILKIEKRDISVLRKLNPSLVELDFYKLIKNKNIEITKRLLSTFAWNYDENQLKIIMKYSTLKKAMNYIDKQKGEKRHTAILYRNYLEMAEGLGYDMKNSIIIYPRDLKHSHDIAAEVNRLKRNNVSCDAIEKIYKSLDKKYRYENSEFIIRPVATLEEFLIEGKRLKHCIANYSVRHSKGECIILFVRKASTPDTPFYTLELSIDGAIRQCRGFENCAMTNEIKTFTEKWLKTKVLQSTARKRKAG